jgi:hypothetical protein
MQMLISKYVESCLEEKVRQRLRGLEPHEHRAQSIFAPYDISARQYTYAILEGLSVGGVSYHETRMGGPKGDVTQFVPGTIQWDSGEHGGGVGWITVRS